MGEVGEAILRAFHDSRNWLVLGVLVLAGHLGGKAIARARLPAIIGYLLVGVVLGTSGLDVVNLEHLGMVSDFGLGIVAFMIGTELSGRLVRRMGRSLLVIILAESFGAFLLVAGLIALACRLLPPEGLAVAAAAVTFGAMAPASAPAGTVAVLQQYRCKGPLTSLLLAVVGLDDGLAVVIYAFAIAWVKASLGHSHLSVAAVAKPLIEVFGGLAVGALVGVGLLLLAAATRTREHVLTLTVGAIMLCTGLANVLHLSLILSNLATGCVMANLSKHQTDRSYAAVRQITHVVFVLFFVVAGAHLDLSVLKRMGLLAPVYIVGRTAGLVGGAWFGATVTGADRVVRRYLGLGILSQAGVAIGLALLVSRELAEFGAAGAAIASITLNTIMATTIFFEILGPITTKIAVSRAGEIGRAAE